MTKGEVLKKPNGITFGERWRLIPCDTSNWELCELRDSKTKDGQTVTRWMRCGRFYQHSTFGGALEYAADVEAKRVCADAERDIRDALSEWRDTLESFREALCAR